MQTITTLPAPQTRAAFWRELLARQPLLAKLAVAHLALVPVVLVGLLVDPRLIAGENPWSKPLKFDLSIAIYAATMAWIVGALPEAIKTSVARRITVAMWIETVIIAVQAARGVRSHFNIATPFDMVAFQVMGIAILYNSWQVVRVLRHYLGPVTAQVAAPLRRATQLGLVSLLVGSIIGGYMAKHLAHAVGVLDGGAGLPLLGWSTRGGDLRIAHFVGLHGLQFLLFAQLLLAAARFPAARQQRVLLVLFGIHMATTMALFSLALRGMPLLGWEG